MIQIIACNNHAGVGEKGLTRNVEALQHYRPDLDIQFVSEVLVEDTNNNPKLLNYDSVLLTNQQLAIAANEVLNQNKIPLNILGDHAASIGTVSASSHHAQNCGLIWVDAHPDLNTDQTTFSAHIHGMSVAALLDLFDDKLNNILFNGQKIKAENVVYLGLRDIDEGEQQFLEQYQIKAFTYDKVKQLGLEKVLKQINEYFSQIDKLHISLDLDVINPQIMPAVSVPVIHGFTVEEVKFIMEQLIENNRIVAVDIVEYNPEYDQEEKGIKILSDMIDLVKRSL